MRSLDTTRKDCPFALLPLKAIKQEVPVFKQTNHPEENSTYRPPRTRYIQSDHLPVRLGPDSTLPHLSSLQLMSYSTPAELPPPHSPPPPLTSMVAIYRQPSGRSCTPECVRSSFPSSLVSLSFSFLFFCSLFPPLPLSALSRLPRRRKGEFGRLSSYAGLLSVFLSRYLDVFPPVMFCWGGPLL